MRFKRFLVTVVAMFLVIPGTASAQITLSASGQQQLGQLALQLVSILTALTQAQQQGTAYTSSPTFSIQAGVWSQQIGQIGQQLTTLIASEAKNSSVSILPTMGGTSTKCPSLTRTLSEGMQGSDVAELQLFLSRDNYGKFLGGVSGYFDSATTLSVQRYQAGYGIVSSGTPEATGFGIVGPGTRASIAAICARGTYVTSVPPITVPTTGPNGVPSSPPPPPPPSPPPQVIGFSTGQLSLVPSLTGQSGGSNSVGISVNMLPNMGCTAAGYTLSFGDGQEQNMTSAASCGNQIKIITHVYPAVGQYTATLKSGSFSTSLVISVQEANNSISLTASRDTSVSLGGIITATYNPGVTCAPGSYTVYFGDNVSQNISFSACTTQSQTLKHTFPQAGTYLISASDALGRTVTASMTAQAGTSTSQ